MVYLIALFLLFSDPVGTWVHEFPDRGDKVYLKISEKSLEVWRVDDSGTCFMLPSQIILTNRAIQFYSGRQWKILPKEDSMKVSFPNDEKVKYHRTETNPENICSETRDV